MTVPYHYYSFLSINRVSVVKCRAALRQEQEERIERKSLSPDHAVKPLPGALFLHKRAARCVRLQEAVNGARPRHYTADEVRTSSHLF